MNKRVRQCNLQHGDAPKNPITFGPPQPMDAKVKQSQLIAKKSDLVDNNQPEETDNGDLELRAILASTETMDHDFLCTGSADVHTGNDSINQDSL